MCECSARAKMSEQEQQLVKKKGKTISTIWKYFGFQESDVEQNKVQCRICYQVVLAPHANTTNLFNHLKYNHKVQYDGAIIQQKADQKDARSTSSTTSSQSSIQDALHRATAYATSSQRHRDITGAITFHIAKDMCPVSTVSNQGFKQLVNTLDKRYAMPSRYYFSRSALPALYDKCRGEVERDVASADYFATTTDLWSSRTMEPYMSLTVHYIDADFNLKTKCLQTAFFPEDHTGQNIAHGLREAMAAWGLKEDKLVCMTTDNAANIKLAPEVNGWMRLQCFGHRLHLAIENAMKDPRIGRAMGLCKKLVSSFSYSWKKKRELAVAQQQLNLPEHSLKTECPTRWGSRQAMIDRVLEQQKAIAQVLSSDRKTRHLSLTWQDVDVLEAINKSLSPLVEFTDTLSGEKYVSVSFFKPTLHLFNNSLLAVQEDDTDLTKSIKKKILDYLNDKYDDAATQELLDMASALDPRFKLKYVSEDNRGSIEASLTTEMRRVMRLMENAPLETAAVPADDTEDAAAAAPKKKKKGLGSFFKATVDQAAEPQPALEKDKAIALELQSYLQAVPLDAEEDPLKWWRESRKFYPRLSILARKYLCIPATSSSSERVFSTGGNIVTCLRSSLKPDHVNRLVFLAKNL
ncbi:zinc finger BED domain-containing protein 1-like [Trematomus bernacchii]|uniref:zinc finger BED domain-containing protein 1-like n=1 Tax=Trematomus bernacchii TaxID=40690 RepID=UPI00146ACDCF|nr:zinc finger BED domain-containing protein 1-like [Trematomus bernacchii]